MRSGGAVAAFDGEVGRVENELVLRVKWRRRSAAAHAQGEDPTHDTVLLSLERVLDMSADDTVLPVDGPLEVESGGADVLVVGLRCVLFEGVRRWGSVRGGEGRRGTVRTSRVVGMAAMVAVVV